MIPMEVRLPSHRRKGFDVKANDKNLEENLNLLEEVRVDAKTRVAAYKKKMK